MIKYITSLVNCLEPTHLRTLPKINTGTDREQSIHHVRISVRLNNLTARHKIIEKILRPISESDSLTVSALACHAADPGSNPARGDDFFN